MKTPGVLAHNVSKHPRKGHRHGKHQARITHRQCTNGVTPLLGGIGYRQGRLDCMGILENDDFIFLADSFIWPNINTPMPA